MHRSARIIIGPCAPRRARSTRRHVGNSPFVPYFIGIAEWASLLLGWEHLYYISYSRMFILLPPKLSPGLLFPSIHLFPYHQPGHLHQCGAGQFFVGLFLNKTKNQFGFLELHSFISLL